MDNSKKVPSDTSVNMDRNVDFFYKSQHPGIILQEYINGLGISQRKLASLIFKKSVEVNYIVKGHRDITPDIAIRFAIIFNTRPDFWIGMQMDYDIYMTYNKNKEKYKNIKCSQE